MGGAISIPLRGTLEIKTLVSKYLASVFCCIQSNCFRHELEDVSLRYL